jgi:hypothetical protein
MAIAVVRELLGFGTLFGIRILPETFVPWTIMIMAPSAFFLVAMVMWWAKSVQADKSRKPNRQLQASQPHLPRVRPQRRKRKEEPCHP